MLVDQHPDENITLSGETNASVGEEASELRSSSAVWDQPEALPAHRQETSAAARPRRSIVPYKAPGADLRKHYRLTLEGGLIASLLLVIGLFHAPLRPATQSADLIMEEQEVVQMEDIQQTEQQALPPPPPRPPVPVAVPDDAILEDEDLNFDAMLEIDEPLATMPPPPPPEEENNTAEEEEEIFIVVEEMPELIGGIASLQKQIRYPEIAQKASIEGRVIVQFIVGTDGSVRDPVVVRGIGGGCDEEALRVVRRARFKPGRQRGKPVPVRFTIPIHFQLR